MVLLIGGQLMLIGYQEYCVDAGKVKVKLTLFLTKYHAMKTYWNSAGAESRILNLGIR
jgi:hypothetical protein